MGINFPDAPTTGQVSGSFTWDGEKWVQTSNPAASSAVRYDLPQSLTANQMAQARSNIAVTKKNYIINGGMQISQENGATAGTATNYYPVDQFLLQYSNTGTQSAQQTTNVATPAGAATRFRVTATVADASATTTEYCAIVTKLEGLRIVDFMPGTPLAKTFTLQFGVRGPAGTYCVGFTNHTGLRCYVAEYVIAPGEAMTSVVKSITVPGDIGGLWAYDNTLSLQIFWTLMAGPSRQIAAGAWTDTAVTCFATANQFNFMVNSSATAPNNTFDLFDVSLTEGAVAPPFQVPDYASELALCQRYWQKLGGTNAAEIYINGYHTAGSALVHVLTFSEMRFTPTRTIVGTWTLTNTAAVTTPNGGPKTCNLQLIATATGTVAANSTSTSYIALNARL